MECLNEWSVEWDVASWDEKPRLVNAEMLDAEKRERRNGWRAGERASGSAASHQRWYQINSPTLKRIDLLLRQEWKWWRERFRWLGTSKSRTSRIKQAALIPSSLQRRSFNKRPRPSSRPSIQSLSPGRSSASVPPPLPRFFQKLRSHTERSITSVRDAIAHVYNTQRTSDTNRLQGSEEMQPWW